VEPFYAVKCNPDPVILKTLALLGVSFDCASQQEIQMVQSAGREIGLHQCPPIIYANPCKARKHLIYAVTQGVTLVTFDNVQEVHKCAAISHKIELVLRIVTDDRGSQCRLSSKYGAPKQRWRNLLHAAKHCGLKVVGVSFHVGSGCRDASRYDLALQDARELFDLAKDEFGFEMTLLDIGGGFPGETHSTWNPEELDKFDDPDYDEDVDNKEGLEHQVSEDNSKGDDTPYMFFTEIAEQVAPMIDRLFPNRNIRVIGEPGRYFVAAAATLVTSVVGARSNEIDHKEFVPEAVNDQQTSREIFERSREDEHALVRKSSQRKSWDAGANRNAEEEQMWGTITEELNQYAQYFAKQNFVTQATDAYNDGLDLYQEDFDTAADLLGVPDQKQMRSMVHSVEGMTKAIAVGDKQDNIFSLAAAGEAAVTGMVMEAVAASANVQDDYSYYLNDGVYGAFNNLMFDHATVRPRVLRLPSNDNTNNVTEKEKDQNLYASTVFGPTCDSIDVIARSVLLPKLKIGDWLYFQNMGAYTMAAASSFNGFTPTEKMYVCSVQPEYFEGLFAGPAETATAEAEPAALADGGKVPPPSEDDAVEEKKDEE
jgi:diaminopimelate decarboxylase